MDYIIFDKTGITERVQLSVTDYKTAYEENTDKV